MSALLGGGAYFLQPQGGLTASRVLISWNTFTVLFLVLAWIWMTGQKAKQISSRYQEEDESAPVILLVVVFAALASLVAITALLSSVKQAGDTERAWRMGLAALTVASSWALVATMFTLHYADLFYRSRAGAADKPLAFPRTTHPVFSDFAYFAFTIAAARQTSDVSTAQGTIRKVVLLQSVVAFIFNLAILGFAINVTAGILGGN